METKNKKMNKLVSLSERVERLKKTPSEFIRGILKLNAFLETDLLSNYREGEREYHFLNRFVPCDLDGNILEKPDDQIGGVEMYSETYQDHLSKVMFEGFEYNKELRNSGGNYTHVFSNSSIDIYKQWGGLYLSGEINLISISDLVQLNINLTPYGAKIAGI